MSNDNLFQEKNKPVSNYRDYRDLNATTAPQYSSQYQSQKPVVEQKREKIDERYGMSRGAWDVTLRFTETLLDIIKAVMVIGGVISANLADVIFGAAGITILFGGSSALFNGTPVWIIGTILSLGASAIQIFLWSAIQKRGITLESILHWKKIPKDMKGFLGTAGVIWLLDTLIDMSPIALLVQNSQYKSIEPLYWAMIFSVSVIVFILCGFSEIMTSNMRSILSGSSVGNQNLDTPMPPKYNTNRMETKHLENLRNLPKRKS